MNQELSKEFYIVLGKINLSYASPNGNYRCHYKATPFRNKSIISIKNEGKASAEDLVEEFKIIDKIVDTALIYCDKPSFIIKYDSRNIVVPSFRIRKIYFQKIKSLLQQGLIEHGAHIENRKAVLAFSKVFMGFFTNLNYSIHSSETEADKKIASLCYQKEKTFTTYENQNDSPLLNSITFPEWSFTSQNNKFTIHAALLSNNILYAKAKGTLNEESLEATYNIYQKVIEYNGGSVGFSIIDFQKISSISRNARKVFETKHKEISPLWGDAFCILPPFALTVYKLYKRFKPNSIQGFDIVADFETAIKYCQGGNPKDELSKTEIATPKKSYEELVEENLKLKQKIDSLRNSENQNIEQLINTLGGITWNESFEPTKNEIEENDPFYDLFETSWILQNDIKEILSAEKESNEKLNRLVLEQTRALRNKENNLRNIINFSDKIIWLVDKDFKLLEANNMFFNYFLKVHKKQIHIGNKFLEMLDQSELKTKLNSWLNHALTGKNATYEFEHKKNNISVIHEYKIFPVLENGNAEAISIRVSDITESRIAERKLNEQNDELRKVNSELDHFVYSVSHDLRAPLTSLMGLINISKNEKNLENILHYISLKEKSVKKLDSFIQDIIDLAKNARTEVTTQEVELESFFDGIICDLKYAKNSESVEIITDIQQDEIFHIDVNRLKVIFSNLISNGLRYADLRKQRPYISISAKITKKEAVIKVADNGQGIKKEHQTKVFDMFYRANQTLNGSGLGLYILNESLKKINGKVELESEYGKGTTFTIKLPFVAQKQISNIL